MNDKGQALIEFIIILPILLFIILSMFDIGNVLHQKYKLENDLDVVVNLFEQNKQIELNDYVNKNKIAFKFNDKDDHVTIEVSKKINISTPGLNYVFKEPYYIYAKRYIYE